MEETLEMLTKIEEEVSKELQEESVETGLKFGGLDIQHEIVLE